jgi:UDP-N-acetylmuramoylalanine--D-glutamate ligase
MQDRQSHFKGKKVTLMGLGLLGRGIGDALFLAEQGAELIVTDLKSEAELASSIDALKKFSNITFHLGGHRLEDFRDRDFILKAAGVPQDSEFLVEARKNNIPIEMSTSLFAKFSPAMIVGITGTRGKSTVTQLVYEVLKNGYKKGNVFLGGNVRGVATLPFLPLTKEGDIAVLELDSWQLQGFGEAKISPHISIFTTFYPDHLNYYKNNLDLYLDDKANIFKHQTENDFLILGSQALDIVKAKYKHIQSTVLTPGPLPSDWNLYMPGEHNRYNAALAAEACKILEIDPEVTKKTIEAFRGVPGRLEFLKEIDGVKIYNDNNSTTPDATIAALKALSHNKNVVLIMGGSDKSINMTMLLNLLPQMCKSIFMLPGTGTDRIKSELEIIPNTHFVSSLHEAVTEARKTAVEKFCFSAQPLPRLDFFKMSTIEEINLLNL